MSHAIRTMQMANISSGESSNVGDGDDVFEGLVSSDGNLLDLALRLSGLETAADGTEVSAKREPQLSDEESEPGAAGGTSSKLDRSSFYFTFLLLLCIGDFRMNLFYFEFISNWSVADLWKPTCILILVSGGRGFPIFLLNSRF